MQNFDTNNLLPPKAGTLGVTQNYALGVLTWDVNYLPSPMTKDAYPALAAAHYDELRAIGQEPDFYTLEEKFDQMQPALGRSVLEQTLGLVPANKQKNNVQTRFRRVAIAKTNPFSVPVLGSRTSPYLQVKWVLLAAEHVYAQVPPLVESLLGIRVSMTQVYRHTQAAAQALPAAALDAPWG